MRENATNSVVEEAVNEIRAGAEEGNGEREGRS